MEHGHAHPSHDPFPSNAVNHDLNRQQTPHHPLSFLGVPNTSSPLRRSPQTPFETPLSLPQRRLQLRNAGFRAPRLPSHRLSTRISRWFSEKDDDNTRRQRNPARNRENSPSTVKRRHTPGTHTQGSILQEITNSSRSRYSEKNTAVPIHEDEPDESPTHSWYHDAPSTQQSPVTPGRVDDSANEMKLREISGNAQRSPPPLSSPLARQIRGRNKRSINLRKTSFPASEHIVFLETRLEEVEKSQYSPNTGLPLKEKIKSLATENNRLEEMLAELEHQFETRLRESVEHKTSVEVNLRRKIKQLEDDLDSKECIIRDLEYRNDNSRRDLSKAEAYKAAVERLESEKQGLEETNRSLEKRNDVLTELLGHSPTRAHHGFELPSPAREQSTKTPRPRSMMPRIPSSPSRPASKRPLSLQTSPLPSQHDYFSLISAFNREHEDPCSNGDPQKSFDDLHSIDSGLGESCSVRSGNDPTSKRSSMHSYTTASPAAWGLPLPPSPYENMAERSRRKRKTRRFASGSTQLKPLVLPTLNTSSGLPQSAPLPDACSNAGRRDISDQFFDPTISFLSHPHDTPTQPRRRSNTWGTADALKALEGASELHFVGFEEVLANGKISQSLPPPPPTFQDLRDSHSFHPAPDQFSPNLIDDMIIEEDSAAFLNNQFEGVGDQSFSSMMGEFSITESEIGRACVEEQNLTTQFLASELARPLSLQHPAFDEAPSPMEVSVEDNTTQAIESGVEALPASSISSLRPVEMDFPNPLASPYILSDARFQHDSDSDPADRRANDPHGCEVSLSGISSIAFSDGLPIQTNGHSTAVGLQNAAMMMPNPLKAQPPLRERKKLQRPQSPLELLRRKGSPTVSVTSVTSRTIFGRISRYTSYVREIRRDPTALARRVIANAWCNNWQRFGKLSWWVLGLFLGPGWKQPREKGQGWESYDGQNIAEVEHERLNESGPHTNEDERHGPNPKQTTSCHSTSGQQKRVKFDDVGAAGRSKQKDVRDKQKLKAKSCEPKSKNSWGQSLYLWGKFSVAIMLAVGGAVIHGPEEMLKECDMHNEAARDVRSEEVGYTQVAGEVDQDVLFDYSLDLLDGDGENNDHAVDDTISSDSSRTAKSVAPSIPRHEQQSLVPLLSTDTHYTFGAPSTNEYDHCDDNGQSRPSRSRAHMMRRQGSIHTSDLYSAPSGGIHDLGTLQWMQSLSTEDFERLQDVDDKDGTIKAIPRKTRRRTRSTLT